MCSDWFEHESGFQLDDQCKFDLCHIDPPFTRLTLIRLADGYLHPYIDLRLDQPQPIPFRPSAVTLESRQAHYSVERPCPLTVCNCITHFRYNPSRTLVRARSVLIHTTRQLTNEMP
jgi:hypothetical protein